MSHLTSGELTEKVDFMYINLLGKDSYTRWKKLKHQSNLVKESEFVQWILDIAEASLNNKNCVDKKKHEISEEIDEEEVYFELQAQDCDDTTCDMEPYGLLSDDDMNAVDTSTGGKPVLANKLQDSIFPAEIDVNRNLDRFDIGIDVSVNDVSGNVNIDGKISADATNNIDKHTCYYCLTSFTSEADRLQHEFSVHDSSHQTRTSEKHTMYSCEICGKSFTRPFGVQRHKKSVHYGLKEHKCSYCNSEFTRKDYLNTHIATHHGGNIFDADVASIMKHDTELAADSS